MVEENMPLSKKTVKKWNFDCLGFETNQDDEVTMIFCKVCREFSKLPNVRNDKKGFAKIGSETFIKGTPVVKKNNFKDHVLKSQTHASAVLRISEKEKMKQTPAPSSSSSTTDLDTPNPNAASQSSSTPTGAPKQTTLLPFIQRLNNQQHQQLVKKMQIAHFTITEAKSYAFYGKLAKFSKEILQVNIGLR